MLASAQRLRLKREFETVFAARRSVSGNLMRLAYVPNRLLLNRFGIVISTKVSKKAVVRNRIRRRLRSIFRTLEPTLRGRYDIVCLCQPAAAKATFQLLREEVISLLESINKKNS